MQRNRAVLMPSHDDKKSRDRAAVQSRIFIRQINHRKEIPQMERRSSRAARVATGGVNYFDCLKP